MLSTQLDNAEQTRPLVEEWQRFREREDDLVRRSGATERRLVAHLYQACDVGQTLAALCVRSAEGEGSPLVLPEELMGRRDRPLSSLHPDVLLRIELLPRTLYDRLRRTSPSVFLFHFSILALTRTLLLHLWLRMMQQLPENAREVMALVAGCTELPVEDCVLEHLLHRWRGAKYRRGTLRDASGGCLPAPDRLVVDHLVCLLVDFWQVYDAPIPDLVDQDSALNAFVDHQRRLGGWLLEALGRRVRGHAAVAILGRQEDAFHDEHGSGSGRRRRGLSSALRKAVSFLVEKLLPEMAETEGTQPAPHAVRLLHWLHHSLVRLPRESVNNEEPASLGPLLASGRGRTLLHALGANLHVVLREPPESAAWCGAMDRMEVALYQLEGMGRELDIFRCLGERCHTYGIKIASRLGGRGERGGDVAACTVALEYLAVETLLTHEFMRALPVYVPQQRRWVLARSARGHRSVLNLREGALVQQRMLGLIGDGGGSLQLAARHLLQACNHALSVLQPPNCSVADASLRQRLQEEFARSGSTWLAQRLLLMHMHAEHLVWLSGNAPGLPPFLPPPGRPATPLVEEYRPGSERQVRLLQTITSGSPSPEAVLRAVDGFLMGRARSLASYR